MAGTTTVNSKHDVQVEFDFPEGVSIGRTKNGKAYIAVITDTNVEEAFDQLRRGADDVFKAVENARREHFIEEVHPALTGCPCGDCSVRGEGR